jgi:hypothetical protein
MLAVDAKDDFSKNDELELELPPNWYKEDGLE